MCSLQEQGLLLQGGGPASPKQAAASPGRRGVRAPLEKPQTTRKMETLLSNTGGEQDASEQREVQISFGTTVTCL